MTKREAAIVAAYTGYLIGDFSDMHKYIEGILKRPVFTHELGNMQLRHEIEKKSKEDFVNINIEV